MLTAVALKKIIHNVIVVECSTEMPLSVAPRRALDQAQVQRISELITSQEQDDVQGEVVHCNTEEVSY